MPEQKTLPMWATTNYAIEQARSYEVGAPRPGAYVGPERVRSAPSLPAMPPMLPEEPGEQEITASALRAMAPKDYYRDDSRTRALGLTMRVTVFGAGAAIVATLGWGVCWMLWEVDIAFLPLSWLAAGVVALVYMLATEGATNHYSAAGIEHAKIEAAVELHKDRLDSRERMHREAAQAWERVVTKALDKWEA